MYWLLAGLTTSFHSIDCGTELHTQRSGDLTKFTEVVVGGRAMRKTHSLCSFHFPTLSLEVVVLSYMPTVERKKTSWPVYYPRPDYKGRSFGWLAQPPTVCCLAHLPHGKLSCLHSSELPLLWLVPASTACLLLLLPSDQQLFYVFSHCASLHLVVLLPTFCVKLTFMLLKGGFGYYVLEQPYEVELKGASL